MNRYIDADKLKAEIERRREKCADIAADERNDEVAEYYYGKEVAHDEISSLVTSLQQEQPEVDFETEYAKFSNDTDALDYAFPIDLADYKDFARHFYELGRLSQTK